MKYRVQIFYDCGFVEHRDFDDFDTAELYLNSVRYVKLKHIDRVEFELVESR